MLQKVCILAHTKKCLFFPYLSSSLSYFFPAYCNVYYDSINFSKETPSISGFVSQRGGQELTVTVLRQCYNKVRRCIILSKCVLCMLIASVAAVYQNIFLFLQLEHFSWKCAFNANMTQNCQQFLVYKDTKNLIPPGMGRLQHPMITGPEHPSCPERNNQR